MGSVPCWRLDELQNGLAVSVPPFALGVGQPELWPHGIAVLCPPVIPDELLQLHSRLGQALQQLNLKTETRPYRAHVTLARQAQGALAPPQGPSIDWLVAGHALMESTGQADQRYRVLHSCGVSSGTP